MTKLVGTQQSETEWLKAKSAEVATVDKDGNRIAVGDIASWYSHDVYNKGVVTKIGVLEQGGEMVPTLSIETADGPHGPGSHFAWVPASSVRVSHYES